jgi:hypothetical protein
MLRCPKCGKESYVTFVASALVMGLDTCLNCGYTSEEYFGGTPDASRAREEQLLRQQAEKFKEESNISDRRLEMLEFTYKGNYPEDMDTECIELCDILNSLPTVKTYESCWGHNKSNYIVFFTVTDWRSISFLARCIDSRYCNWQSNWILYAYNNDTPNQGKFKYLLECKYSGKEDILSQVTNLISNMYIHINHRTYIDSFLINLDGFQVTESFKEDSIFILNILIFILRTVVEVIGLLRIISLTF